MASSEVGPEETQAQSQLQSFVGVLYHCKTCVKDYVLKNGQSKGCSSCAAASDAVGGARQPANRRGGAVQQLATDKTNVSKSLRYYVSM
jgi:hypothetical protein